MAFSACCTAFYSGFKSVYLLEVLFCLGSSYFFIGGLIGVTTPPYCCKWKVISFWRLKIEATKGCVWVENRAENPRKWEVLGRVQLHVWLGRG
jgi:hypothetical protein